MRNNKWLQTTLPALLILIAAVSAAAQRPTRAQNRQTATLLNRIETRTDRFRNSLDDALDQGKFDGTAREDQINDHVQDFENATDRLRERFRLGRASASDVTAVLTPANEIDSFMRRNNLGTAAERDWNVLRTDLQSLATRYNLTWTGANADPNPPYGDTASGLNGTFRLNSSQSDDIDRVAERATANLRYNQRRSAREEIARRLVTPDQLALQRRNNEITIASSLAPQMTLNANGRVYQERTPEGRLVSVTAAMQNENLTITYAGDTGQDYAATFTPLESGRRLQLTRRVYITSLRQTVQANTYFDRTSTVADLNLYRDNDSGTVSGNGTFIIPNNTILSGTLNEDLSTRATREGERFTMLVNTPSAYSGATLEGSVAHVERSGRVSGRAKMTLDFDRIRLRDGRTYTFAGTLESIRFANGDTVAVDTEGVVRDGDNQTNRTVTRTGIGTAIGAIIGAVAGGGKGAVIGAVAGAGVGAGSVIAQGREDLELKAGTEITLRASAPANVTAVR